jgi:acyl-CoA synthetase (NDP forming)
VIFVPPIMVEPRTVVEKISRACRNRTKPVFSVLMAEEHYYRELPQQFEDAPPLYRFPETAVRALAEMDAYRVWCERPEGEVRTFPANVDEARAAIDACMSSGGGFLAPDDVNTVLAAYGLPVCRMELVPLDGDLTAAAKRVGYPVVLKVHGHTIIHKSDFGGVVVGIQDEEQLEHAASSVRDKLREAGVAGSVEGLLVQEMAAPGREVIIGMMTDPLFGPLLAFGMGGKYVEITKDIEFRVMPVTDVDAREMVEAVKSYPILEGVRGDERVDIDFIVESIQRLAQLVNDFPQITELDMNPVIVAPKRDACKVVDARIRVG